MNSAPFSAVVLAGHVNMGNGYVVWCECGTQDCICDPGETPHVRRDSSGPLSKADTGALLGAQRTGGFDPGAGVMLFTFALLLGLRLRF